MVLKPGREAMAEAIFRKWELDFAVIGHVTDSGHMVLKWNGDTVADIPLAPLADEAPLYDRPYLDRAAYRQWADIPPLGAIPDECDMASDLLRLMASPDIASRRWIWEQYDNKVGGDTVQPPGGDAALVRVHGTEKALAMTTDCTPRYCFADPFEGGKQAVAESFRNLCAVGAKPLAITNCLNFGNPQRPEIMAQIVGCLEGMSAACRALDMPIVSGNVSLYNESKATGGGSAILPTPAIGAVGLLTNWRQSATIAFKAAGDEIWLIGDDASGSHHSPHEGLGQSLWLREICGREAGDPPPVDLDAELRNGLFIRGLIGASLATSVHDVSDGGVLVALAEMALAGTVGAEVDLAAPRPVASSAFGEMQGRYIVSISPDQRAAFLAMVAESGVAVSRIGATTAAPQVAVQRGQGQAAAVIPLAALRAAHEGFFPNLMNG